eukprot:NODE_10609_length_482_cov_41.273239_g10586_i0.p2 GENE.NODE_10609_length_482_cov_41.273239_g10586_i0~~NODE_10609_length_482_cov_41.273239_g10586_i0.p2  ORF type:complete len:138 (-),score=13.59 NODE_10609_length_482_cov_41.273239_g10586_i0:23-436(-)
MERGPMRGGKTNKSARSALFGGGRKPEASKSEAQELTEQQMEEGNNERLDALGCLTGRLKESAQGLQDETNLHLSMMDKMQTSFADARAGLGGVMRNLDTTMKHGGAKHRLLMTVGILLLFIGLWWLITRKPAKHSS